MSFDYQEFCQHINFWFDGYDHAGIEDDYFYASGMNWSVEYRPHINEWTIESGSFSGKCSDLYQVWLVA